MIIIVMMGLGFSLTKLMTFCLQLFSDFVNFAVQVLSFKILLRAFEWYINEVQRMKE